MDGLVGVAQVGFHLLADAAEEFVAAGEDDPAGLAIVEEPQDHAGEKQKQSEEHADMDMQGKATLSELLRHCGSSLAPIPEGLKEHR
ncbi:hypothetical protein D3C76_964430 [compost metagenome]